MKTGEDVFIDEFSKFKRPERVHIGSHVAIDWGFYCTTRLYVGNHVHIGPYVSVIGGVDGALEVWDFVTISAGARIICRSDSFSGNGLVTVPGLPDEYKNEILGGTVRLKDFSALGAGAVMMANTWLAEGVVIGANSLVTKPIEEPWTVWVGSPARKLKDRPREKILEYASKLVGYKAVREK